MRTIKRFILAGLACLTVTAAHAGTVKYNGYLANESGVSTAKTYPLSLNSYAIDQLSFQLSWATAAPAAVTFTDGQESTTTITVTSNAGISTATATAYLTVLSTNVPGLALRISTEPPARTPVITAGVSIRRQIPQLMWRLN